MSASAPTIGELLTVIPGNWNGNPTFTYQWVFSTNGTSGWTNISGATSSTFTVTSTQLSGYIACNVTGYNQAGQFTNMSAPTGLVTASTPAFSTLTTFDLVKFTAIGTATEAAGVFTCPLSGNYTGFYTNSTYTLVNSSVFAEMGSLSVGAGTKQYTFKLQDAQLLSNTQNALGFTWQNGSLTPYYIAAGVTTNGTAIALAGPSIYVKFAESSGTVTWSYSTNGTSWTTAQSVADPFSSSILGSLYISSSNGYYSSAESASSATFSNLNNFVPISAPPTSNLLKYSPPAQTSPTIVTVGTGHFSATYSSTQDVILNMPSSVNTGGIQITGGRHIRIIGGYIRNTGGGSTIRMGNVTGSIFLEGLLMDGTGTTATDPDCLNLSGSTSTDVYVQNCRLTGYHGYHDSAAQHHSDLYQPQGPSRNIYVDMLSGDTSYQGFFVSPNLSVPQNINSLAMSRVNLSHNTVMPNGTVTTSSLIWLLDGYPSQTPYPASFDQVYVKPRSGQTAISEETYPVAGIATVGAITGPTGGITWPAVMKVTGEINPGGLTVPPGGDFAPAGNTVSGAASSSPGLNYVSPGYQ